MDCWQQGTVPCCHSRFLSPRSIATFPSNPTTTTHLPPTPSPYPQIAYFRHFQMHMPHVAAELSSRVGQCRVLQLRVLDIVRWHNKVIFPRVCACAMWVGG